MEALFAAGCDRVCATEVTVADARMVLQATQRDLRRPRPASRSATWRKPSHRFHPAGGKLWKPQSTRNCCHVTNRHRFYSRGAIKFREIICRQRGVLVVLPEEGCRMPGGGGGVKQQ